MSLISDGELRRTLQSLGVDVGPINNSTRGLYQKKLRSLRGANNKNKTTLSYSKKNEAPPKGLVGNKRKRVNVDYPASPASPASSKKPRVEGINKSPLPLRPIPYPPKPIPVPQRPISRPIPSPQRPILVPQKPFPIPQIHPSRPFPGDPEAVDRLPARSNLYPDLSNYFAPPLRASNIMPKQHTPPLSDSHDSQEQDHDSSSMSLSSSQSFLSDIFPDPSPPPAISPRPPHDPYVRSPPPAIAPRPPHDPYVRSPPPAISPRPPRPHDPYVRYPPSSASPSQPEGFLKTVTKFIGSRVNKFMQVIEPRQPLSNKDIDKVTPPSGEGIRRARLPSRVDFAAIEESCLDGNEETAAMLPPNRVPSPSLPSLKSKRYDWELENTDVVLAKKRDGSLWKLGSGGFGEVYKGLRDGIDEVAVKVIRLRSSSPSTIEQFKSEIDLISQLRHRHIVQFYGACIQPLNLYMVTELMSNDLLSVLRLPRETEKYKWTGIYGKEVLLGVAAGLNYLHSRKPPVVHRDIKSPNILVMDGIAKIADVGVARTMGASDMTAQKGYTIAWAAPEVVYRRRATEKIDIWSLGIIIWEVVTGRLPKAGRLELPMSSPVALKSLFTQCVSDNPVNRPTAQRVIAELKNIRSY